MKNKFGIIISVVIALLLQGCYDREIDESKPGTPISPVTNLNHAIDGNNVILTWELPAQFPDDIIIPVSVSIKVYIDNVLKSSPVVADGPVTYTYTTYDPAKSYIFVVKVVGTVDTDNPNVSKTRYSPGEYIIID